MDVVARLTALDARFTDKLAESDANAWFVEPLHVELRQLFAQARVTHFAAPEQMNALRVLHSMVTKVDYLRNRYAYAMAATGAYTGRWVVYAHATFVDHCTTRADALSVAAMTQSRCLIRRVGHPSPEDCDVDYTPSLTF